MRPVGGRILSCITFLGMAPIGAHRKQVSLPTDFRSPPENGHSRYAYPTARFVPFATFVRRSLLATGDQWPHGGVLGQLPKTMKPTPFTSDAEPPRPRGGPLVTVGLA